ncbi:hypothetical protein SUN_2417 [Sulfurovum sp. NBC37-1]|nr:hypothetical protein SUN_2417 [Sulfurovum sp. NBC37-1]
MGLAPPVYAQISQQNLSILFTAAFSETYFRFFEIGTHKIKAGASVYGYEDCRDVNAPVTCLKYHPPHPMLYPTTPVSLWFLLP